MLCKKHAKWLSTLISLRGCWGFFLVSFSFPFYFNSILFSHVNSECYFAHFRSALLVFLFVLHKFKDTTGCTVVCFLLFLLNHTVEMTTRAKAV